MVKITIAGKIDDGDFLQAATCARALNSKESIEIEILEFFETEWQQYLKNKTTLDYEKLYCHKTSPLI